MLATADETLLTDCLNRRPQAWTRLVDRSLPTVLGVVDHCRERQGWDLSAMEQQVLVRQVFVQLAADDLALIRSFCRGGNSSWDTYLTVIARRIVLACLQEQDHLTRVTDATKGTLLTAQ